MSTLGDLADRGLVRTGVVLGELTTYKLGGPAAWFAEPGDDVELGAVVGAARAAGVPIAVLGRGSNLVISSLGYTGLVLRPAGRFAAWRWAADGRVVAGCGVPLPLLARRTAAAGRGGLEFFSGIPGSVGGAVCMNAGCHGTATSEWIVTARVMDLRTATVSEWDRSRLAMSYRKSAVGPDDLVLDATFRTVERDPEECEREIRAIARWRREHQPGGTLNAGSVFKNPPGDAAGRIIDSVGLKGHRVGGACVSRRHANFFEADPGATPEDVHRLVADVRRRVAEATGVLLEAEVRFLGEFGTPPP